MVHAVNMKLLFLSQLVYAYTLYKRQLPACAGQLNGQECTSAGNGAVGSRDSIIALCNSCADQTRQRGQDPAGKLQDCLAKVNGGDRNPVMPLNTFGRNLCSANNSGNNNQGNQQNQNNNGNNNQNNNQQNNNQQNNNQQNNNQQNNNQQNNNQQNNNQNQGNQNGRLPACTGQLNGQECTSAGNGAVGSRDSIIALCNSCADQTRQRGQDPAGKLQDCLAKVNGGDRNPVMPLNTFGRNLCSA
jgi:ribosomal protein L37AE/L43A